MKAILAIYPLSSATESSKKSIATVGRNERTPPTPAIIPSVRRSVRTGATPAAAVASPMAVESASKALPSIPDISPPPSVKVRKKTQSINRRKHGIAEKRPQMILSALSDLLSESVLGITKHSRQSVSTFRYLLTIAFSEKSGESGLLLRFSSPAAVPTRASIPVFSTADTAKTGIPSIFSSFFVSQYPPCSVRRSYILSASTAGSPVSAS